MRHLIPTLIFLMISYLGFSQLPRTIDVTPDTACVGEEVVLDFLGQGGAMNLVWYFTSTDTCPTSEDTNIPLNTSWSVIVGSIGMDPYIINTAEVSNIGRYVVWNLANLKVRACDTLKLVSELPSTPVSNGDVAVCFDYSSAILSVVPVPGIEFDWYDPNGVYFGTGVNIAIPIGLSSNTYVYEAEARGAATGCISTLREPVTLTVTEELTCDVIPNPATICESNGQQIFTANPQGGTAPYSYEWSTTDGVITGSTDGATIAATAIGTYNVSITDMLMCTTMCSATLNINPNPSCSISPSNPEICASMVPQIFTATASAGSSPYDYVWEGLNGGTISGSNIGASIDAISTGLYQVTVTDANGCPVIRSETLTVNDNPVCAISPNNASVCQSVGMQEFTAEPTGAGPFNFVWSTTNGTIDGPTNMAVITATAEGTYSVIITDAEGCESTCSVDLTINDDPSVGPPNSAVCVDESVIINGSPNGGSTPYTHLWTLVNAGTTGAGNGNLVGITNQILQFNADALAPGIVVLNYKVTDFNGCAANESINLEVTDVVIPVFRVDSIYCLDEIPDSLPTISFNGISGTWSPDEITTNVPGNKSYTFNPASACADPFVFSVTVLAPPILDSLTPSVQGVCGNGSSQAIAIHTSEDRYKWNLIGNGIVQNNSGTTDTIPSINLTYADSVLGSITGSAMAISEENCESSPQNFVINIYPYPQIDNIQDRYFCHGQNLAGINVEVNPSLPGSPNLSMEWASSISDGSDSSVPLQIMDGAVENTGTDLVSHPFEVDVNSNYSNVSLVCSNETTFNVHVRPEPDFNTGPPGDKTYCHSESVAIQVTGNLPTSLAIMVFEWEGGGMIGLVDGSSSTDMSFQSSNSDIENNTTREITITPTASFTMPAAVCEGKDYKFDITVFPLPRVTLPTIEPVYCEDDVIPEISFDGSPRSRINYQWSATNDIGVGVGPLTANEIPTFIALAGNTPNVAVFTVTPQMQGPNPPAVCEGVAEEFTITVNPKPSATLELDKEVTCANEPRTLTINGTANASAVLFRSDNGSTNTVDVGEVINNITPAGRISPYEFKITEVTSMPEGCKNYNEVPVSLKVWNNPIAEFNSFDNVFEFSTGNPVTFLNESSHLVNNHSCIENITWNFIQSNLTQPYVLDTCLLNSFPSRSLSFDHNDGEKIKVFMQARDQYNCIDSMTKFYEVQNPNSCFVKILNSSKNEIKSSSENYCFENTKEFAFYPFLQKFPNQNTIERFSVKVTRTEDNVVVLEPPAVSNIDMTGRDTITLSQYTFDISQSGTYSIMLEIEDNHGEICTDEKEVLIFVLPQPNAQIEIDKSPICPDEITNFRIIGSGFVDRIFEFSGSFAGTPFNGETSINGVSGDFTFDPDGVPTNRSVSVDWVQYKNVGCRQNLPPLTKTLAVYDYEAAVFDNLNVNNRIEICTNKENTVYITEYYDTYEWFFGSTKLVDTVDGGRGVVIPEGTNQGVLSVLVSQFGCLAKRSEVTIEVSKTENPQIKPYFDNCRNETEGLYYIENWSEINGGGVLYNISWSIIGPDPEDYKNEPFPTNLPYFYVPAGVSEIRVVTTARDTSLIVCDGDTTITFPNPTLLGDSSTCPTMLEKTITGLNGATGEILLCPDSLLCHQWYSFPLSADDFNPENNGNYLKSRDQFLFLGAGHENSLHFLRSWDSNGLPCVQDETCGGITYLRTASNPIDPPISTEIPFIGQVVPNPNFGVFDLSFTNSELGIHEIQIINNIGLQLLKTEVEKTDVESSVPIKFSQFGAGVYFCKIQSPSGQVEVVPFVKQ